MADIVSPAANTKPTIIVDFFQRSSHGESPAWIVSGDSDRLSDLAAKLIVRTLGSTSSSTLSCTILLLQEGDELSPKVFEETQRKVREAYHTQSPLVIMVAGLPPDALAVMHLRHLQLVTPDSARLHTHQHRGEYRIHWNGRAFVCTPY